MRCIIRLLHIISIHRIFDPIRLRTAVVIQGTSRPEMPPVRPKCYVHTLILPNVFFFSVRSFFACMLSVWYKIIVLCRYNPCVILNLSDWPTAEYHRSWYYSRRTVRRMLSDEALWSLNEKPEFLCWFDKNCSRQN